MKYPISVGILTRNSGLTLRRALESVKDFDDIIICDGGSEDDTLDIARSYGTTILHQDAAFLHADGSIKNYSGVRNQTLRTARHGWFLFLDSDEHLSAEAAVEMGGIAGKPIDPGSPLAYWLPRKTIVRGTVIECATSYPNRQMRFFHREGVTEFIKEVHERIALRPDIQVGTLTHPEFVPLDMSREELFRKQRRYLQIEVERQKGQSVWQWLRGPVKGAARSSLSYLVRHVRILLFCRGTFMPWWVEWMHHWYNAKLVVMTGAKFFKRRG